MPKFVPTLSQLVEAFKQLPDPVPGCSPHYRVPVMLPQQEAVDRVHAQVRETLSPVLQFDLRTTYAECGRPLHSWRYSGAVYEDKQRKAW